MAQKTLDEYYAELDEIREFVRTAPISDPSKAQWIRASLDLALTEVMGSMAIGAVERAKARRKRDRDRRSMVAGMTELPFDHA